jgi:hypothetical protein
MSEKEGWGTIKVKLDMGRQDAEKFVEDHRGLFPHSLKLMGKPSSSGKCTLSTRFFGKSERVTARAALLLLGWSLVDQLVVFDAHRPHKLFNFPNN